MDAKGSNLKSISMFETMVRCRLSLKGSMTKRLIPRFVPLLKEVATCNTHFGCQVGNKRTMPWLGLFTFN